MIDQFNARVIHPRIKWSLLNIPRKGNVLEDVSISEKAVLRLSLNHKAREREKNYRFNKFFIRRRPLAQISAGVVFRRQRRRRRQDRGASKTTTTMATTTTKEGKKRQSNKIPLRGLFRVDPASKK